jgi:queuine/archaeosine tRNA-ribosyltransferase
MVNGKMKKQVAIQYTVTVSLHPETGISHSNSYTFKEQKHMSDNEVGTFKKNLEEDIPFIFDQLSAATDHVVEADKDFTRFHDWVYNNIEPK